MYSQNKVLNVDFQEPKNFIEKVVTLQQQMPHILDDFKNSEGILSKFK